MKLGIACEGEIPKDKSRFRSKIHSEAILELLTAAFPSQTKPAGAGTLQDPYRPTKLSDWFWLAKQDSGFLPMHMLIGGMYIARWGTGGGQFVDYCTDVTLFHDIVEAKCSKPGVKYEDAIREDIGRWYVKKDEESGIDPDLPSYTRKALRKDVINIYHLDDRAAALACRRIIEGQTDDSEGCPELASSLASLLIGEAHRSPETFLITLMLLDLIETGTTYGSGEKHYTWKSMLMYGTGGIPGRGQGEQERAKHPMVGTGTAPMGRDLYGYTLANPVRDKVISIMSIWLAHYMQKNNPKYEFFIIRSDGPTPWTGPRMPAARNMEKGDQMLRSNCQKAVTARSQTAQLLIGGTTVGYQDVAGKRV